MFTFVSTLTSPVLMRQFGPSGHRVVIVGQMVQLPPVLSGQTVIDTDPVHLVGTSGQEVTTFGHSVAICGQTVNPLTSPMAHCVMSPVHSVTVFGHSVSIFGHSVSMLGHSVCSSTPHSVGIVCVTHCVTDAGQCVVLAGQMVGVTITGHTVAVPVPFGQTVCLVGEHCVGVWTHWVFIDGHVVTDVSQNVQAVGEVAHSVDCRGHIVGVCGQAVLSIGHLVVATGQMVGCVGHCVSTASATHIVGVGGHSVTTCGHSVATAWQTVGVPRRSAQTVIVSAPAQSVARAGHTVTAFGHTVSAAAQTVSMVASGHSVRIAGPNIVGNTTITGSTTSLSPLSSPPSEPGMHDGQNVIMLGQ